VAPAALQKKKSSTGGKMYNKADGNYRLGLVPAGQIKRMPCFKTAASRKSVNRVKEFAGKRGCYMPVVISEAGGCMTLLAGAATFNACIEEKKSKIPAVIVKTEGGADDLMFALQSAELDETPDALSISAAIVQLIDVYGTTRKQIAESLGKSKAWINRVEGLTRRLNETVQSLVADGHITARSAQEIARLPGNAQTVFAISAGNEFLNKDDIAYLVSRYLNGDTGGEERSRIIHTPKLALPDQIKGRRRRVKDRSDSARLSRAIAACLDGASSLSRLLGGVDISGVAVHAGDIADLIDSLAALTLLLKAKFYPGGKNVGSGSDNDGAAVMEGDAIDKY
jgi:ParB-like chromosome segregation protein Spo0J